MLSREDYIRISLATNLFFMRIMKEHAFFLKASFTAKNLELAETANYFLRQFEALLQEAVQLSDGVLTRAELHSRQFVTQYTLQAEKLTQYYTGILVDTSTTIREANLTLESNLSTLNGLEGSVSDLNQRAIYAVTALISFKNKLVSDVLACRVFMQMYGSMIEHILREAVYYSGLLIKLQNKADFRTQRDLIDREIFWNAVLADHARFSEGLLDPSEKQLKTQAIDLARDLDALTVEAKQAQDNPALVVKATADSLAVAQQARDSDAAGVSGLLSCKLRAIILPLLADHILRETNHYIYVLQEASTSPGS